MSPGRKKARASRAAAPGSADASVDLMRLIEIVAAFSRQTICVLGDFVADEFVSGEISRVSREAPVLILRYRHSRMYPGGAANAANNLADLGARVLPVGIVGDDEGGRNLLDYFRAKGVNVSGMQRVRDWTTAVKTRYLAGWTHTTEQQVLRVDREPPPEVPERVQHGIHRAARRFGRDADAVLVSDYGLGAATPALVGGILRGLGAKRVMLDSRYRMLEYRGAGITAATPNEAELEAAYHTPIGADVPKLEQFGRRALSDLDLEALVVTRGKDGLSLFESAPGDAQAARHIPIYGSDTPVDVTGAGDTVIAAFTLALAAGATYLEAAHLANYAGGIVVMTPRTATVTRASLESALRREATAQR